MRYGCVLRDACRSDLIPYAPRSAEQGYMVNITATRCRGEFLGLFLGVPRKGPPCLGVSKDPASLNAVVIEVG
jgi:hypothetical protein